MPLRPPHDPLLRRLPQRRERAARRRIVPVFAACAFFVAAADPSGAQVAPPPAATPPAASTADRVTLNFDNIDLRSVIQFILRERNVNLVTGEALSEKVTVKITNLEWRQALQSILKAHNYAMVEENGILRVTRLPRGDDLAAERFPLIVRLRYSDPVAVKQILAPLLSKNGHIEALAGSGDVGRTLSIIDSPQIIDVIRDLIPTIDVPPRDAIGEITKNDDGTVNVRLQAYPLDDLAMLLNATLGLNVYVSGTHAALLNARLEKVAWPQALALILRDVDCAYREENGVIVITSRKSAQEELVTREFSLRFVDGWDMKRYLEKMLSGAGKITCFAPAPHGGFQFGSKITEQRAQDDTRDRGESVRSRVISVTDRPEIVTAIAERIQALDVMPRQIEVEVVIVQVTKDDERSHGIDWNAVLSIAGATRPHTLPWDPAGGRYFPPFPTTTSGFTFGSLSADQLTAVLRLIDQSENAEIVSKPNITTLDSVEARILIGQKFPVTTETIDPQTAVRTVSLAYYEDIGIQLIVIPTVAEGDRVHMVIHPAVSALLDLVDNRFPVISTREADTQVLLRSGETAVIGGLIEQTTSEKVRKVPVLGSVPLLRWLFRHRESVEEKTELIIFVTPHIVRERGEAERAMDVDRRRSDALRALRVRFEELLTP
ncbi:MAG: hypothetical protein L0Z55_12915 [Planctomycetes bacterium]|nr:hypothetical protein [Planctomycetota bacterium]